MPPVFRPHLPATALVAALLTLLCCSPALAADASVTIADKAFAPADVTISSGESVTWTWNESGHNVHVVSGPVSFDSGFKDAGGTFARPLTAAGTYRYVCDAHPSMRGSVTVGTPAAGPGPAVATAAPAAAGGAAALRLSAVSLSRLAVVRLNASAAGTLRARLVRGQRVVKRWTLPLAAGANRVPLAVRGVRLGRYRLELHAVDGAGRVAHRLFRPLTVTPAARTRRLVAPVPAPVPAPAAAPAPAPVPAGDAPDDSDGRVRPDRQPEPVDR